MPFDTANIPEPLVSAYREGRCAILVGAGASVGAGLPTWKRLLELMIAEAEKLRLVKGDELAEYEALVDDSTKFLMLAGSVKEDLRSNFDAFVEATFITPMPERPRYTRPSCGRLAQIRNHDKLRYSARTRLSKKRQIQISGLHIQGHGRNLASTCEREFFMLKAHGDAAKPGDGIILTEIDYRELLYRQRAYQSLLASMFSLFTIVFVGASLADPEIRLLLGYLVDKFAPTG